MALQANSLVWRMDKQGDAIRATFARTTYAIAFWCTDVKAWRAYCYQGGWPADIKKTLQPNLEGVMQWTETTLTERNA